MWEQLSLAAFMQRYWADNQVSCTITFDPATEGKQLKAALETFQYQLKGVSFLPQQPQGAYAQMPYEQIDEATYKAKVAKLKPLSLKKTAADGETSECCVWRAAVALVPELRADRAAGCCCLSGVPDSFCDADGKCTVPQRKK